MAKEKKKIGFGRVLLRILAALLALILCAAAFLFFVPLAQHGDRAAVPGAADWMARVNGGLPLNDLNLPGSHDSATQYVQLAWFSRCQDRSIGAQLEAGCRYLDIRLGADGDRLKLMHGFTNCKTGPFGGTLYLDAVLAECYAFLEQHPTETVVFAVKQEHGDESVAEFQRLLDAYVRQSPERWLLTDAFPTLDEARGKLVLLRRYSDEAGLGAAAGIPFAWANQKGQGDLSHSSEPNDKGFYTLWVQDRFEYESADKWTAFLNGLEQNGAGPGDLALHFLSTKGSATYGHPHRYAKELNAKLMQQDLANGQYLGWIVLDEFSAPLAAEIYKTNF